MIKSMTGFGRGEVTKDGKTVAVEIKSVNHRYLDLNIKSPRIFNAYENLIRNTIKGRIARGKLDVYVTFEEDAENKFNLLYHPEIARTYFEKCDEIAKEFGLKNDISVGRLVSFPDVFTLEDVHEDDEIIQNILLDALNKALDAFIENRQSEGMRLREDFLEKLEEMEGYVNELEIRSPMIIEEYRQRLTEKIQSLVEDVHIDESRLAMEVTIYADKVCIDEEMVRLKSHVKEAKDALDMEEVGRKLDFVAQEMNREANTILSKSTDVEIANIGISLKTLIEKIREQIQNIE